MPSYPKSRYGLKLPLAPGLLSPFGQDGIWLVTGDGFWENVRYFTWSDPVWLHELEQGDGQLNVVGTWATNFRPIQMRLTSDDPKFEMLLKDTNGDDILDDTGADYDGTWLDLVFGDYDIDILIFDDIDAMTGISKIEFK